MSRILTLVSGFGWHVQDLIRASRIVGVQLEPVLFTKLVGLVGQSRSGVEAGGEDVRNFDAVLVRMMPPGSLEQVVFRMDALHWLNLVGIPVLNPPRAIEMAVDKYLALMMLEQEGLPVPETWVGESASGAQLAFDRLGGDVVVKPLFGSEGRGLVRVSDPELAARTFRTLERLGSVLYVQEHVRNPGYDVRAFVLAGRILGAIRRYAKPGEWRTNVAVGGRAEVCTLDDEARRLAIIAAQAVGGAIMAGVDLLPDLDRGGYRILEVNTVPGWKALGEATGVDVAAEILTELRVWKR